MGDQNLMKAPGNRWLRQVSKKGVLRERSRQFDALLPPSLLLVPSLHLYLWLSQFFSLAVLVCNSAIMPGLEMLAAVPGKSTKVPLFIWERERASGAPWRLSNLTQLTSCNIWSKCFKKEGKEEHGLSRVVTRMSRRPWKESQLQLNLCKVN